MSSLLRVAANQRSVLKDVCGREFRIFHQTLCELICNLFDICQGRRSTGTSEYDENQKIVNGIKLLVDVEKITNPLIPVEPTIRPLSRLGSGQQGKVKFLGGAVYEWSVLVDPNERFVAVQALGRVPLHGASSNARARRHNTETAPLFASSNLTGEKGLRQVDGPVDIIANVSLAPYTGTKTADFATARQRMAPDRSLNWKPRRKTRLFESVDRCQHPRWLLKKKRRIHSRQTGVSATRRVIYWRPLDRSWTLAID